MGLVEHFSSLLVFFCYIVRIDSLCGFILSLLFVTQEITELLHCESQARFNRSKWLLECLRDLGMGIAAKKSQHQCLPLVRGQLGDGCMDAFTAQRMFREFSRILCTDRGAGGDLIQTESG